MKHDITAPGGIQFKEDTEVKDGKYRIYQSANSLFGYRESYLGDGRWLAKNYTPGEVICLSPRDYAGVMSGKISRAYDPAGLFSQGGTVNRAPEMNLILHAASTKDEPPWNTVMSAPEGVRLETRHQGKGFCIDGEGEKLNGQWFRTGKEIGTPMFDPPTHWRYPKE